MHLQPGDIDEEYKRRKTDESDMSVKTMAVFVAGNYEMIERTFHGNLFFPPKLVGSTD